MSYQGQVAAHVVQQSKTMRGGTGLAKMTMSGRNAVQNRGGSWQIIKNEELKSGSNIYRGGYPNIAAELVARKRIIAKEVSPERFDTNVKAARKEKAHLTAQTLNQFHSSQMNKMVNNITENAFNSDVFM